MSTKRILIIDNQDSFVYNLVQLVREAKGSCFYDVVRADALESCPTKRYDALLISPGPGLPDDEPLMMKALDEFKREGKPILGICLGCQAIAVSEGYDLKQIAHPLHGHTSRLIYDADDLLFEGIPSGSAIARYHSWVVDMNTCTSTQANLVELAYSLDADGRQTMALRHKTLPIWGLQFHPESMISEYGARYISNWLSVVLS